ncbi:PAS domain-containing protein [Candidatus Desantisbacteria bacterium]|nr:PAS domain-containing protein [Candidatus Desantisbacteria bacterium]
MKTISLKSKFMISFSAMILLLVLPIVIFTSTTLTKMLRGELIKRGMSIAKNIASGWINLFLTENVSEFQMLIFVNDLKNQEDDIEYIFITDSNGEILVHTFLDGFPVELKNINVLNKKHTSSVQTIDTDKGIILDIGIRLSKNGIGEVHLGITEKSIQETINNLLELLIGITILVILSAIALSVFFAKKITDPLNEIIKVSKSIGSGNINQRVNVKTKNEIGELGVVLNKMAEDLSGILVSKDSLERSYEFTKTILNSMNDSIAIIDINDFKIIAVNSVFLEGCGIDDNSKVIGKKCYEITHKRTSPCSPPYDICPLMETVKTGKYAIAEHIHYRQNGDKRFVEVSTSPIKDNNGNIFQVVHISKDITEPKELKFQLTQQQKLESIGTLAAGIAHEINTPIQFIGDNVRFLNDSVRDIFELVSTYKKLQTKHIKDSNDFAEQIKQIESKIDLEFFKDEIPKAITQTLEGVDRVSNIVKAMKDFSHMGTGEKAKEDINKAIETTVTISRNEWKYTAELITNLDRSLPLVNCIIGEIKQVILNLIINAAHAIKEKGKESNKGIITITTCKKDSFAVITVRDTGVGIKPEIRSRIFEPFFTTKEVGKGTGQGLSISYQTIVKKHKGNLSFESEPGIGSAFIVELPIE